MDLREKTLLSLAIVFVIIFLTLIAYSSTIFLKNYQVLEDTSVDKLVTLVEFNINTEISHLKTTAFDWGVWDEAYSFMSGENPDFIKNNFGKDIFAKLDINFIIYTNASGGIVYAQGYDYDTKELVPVPQGIYAELGSGNSPLQNLALKEPSAGFLNIPEQSALVASHPILHNDQSGPPKGMVILGKFLSKDEIARLSSGTIPSLSITPVDKARLAPAVSASLNSGSKMEGSPALVLPLDDNRIEGLELLKDIYGNDAFVLEIQITRDISLAGKHTIFLFILLQLVTGLIMMAFIVVLVDRLVLVRISAFNTEIRDITKRADLSSRIIIDGNDEITQLAVTTNRMLEQIKKGEEYLMASEEKYRTLIENVPLKVFLKDKNSVYISCNELYAKDHGIRASEIKGKTDADFYPEELVKKYRDDDRKIVETGKQEEYDEAYCIAGEWFIVHTIKTPVRDKDGNVIGIIGAFSDVTKQKRIEKQLAEESQLTEALGLLSNSLLNPTNNIEDICTIVLDHARTLTGSRHGYVSAIDPKTGDNIKYTFTQMVKGECAIDQKKNQIVFHRGKDGTYPSLWGAPLNLSRGFYTNDPPSHPASQGVPEGHVPMKNFLSTPVKIGNELMGQIALANSDREYSEKDLIAVERMGQLYALALLRLRDEQKIAESLREKETLLKEIHHRVKNNLQLVISLLNLQSARIRDPKTLEAIRDSQTRVKAMALVHEKLYRSENLAEIDINDYLQFLVKNLFSFYSGRIHNVKISMDIHDIRVTINSAIPLGLIVNEIVTNSLKYAFSDGRSGEIILTGEPAEGSYEFTIGDNGIGMPVDFDWKNSDTLGMKLINSLVEQLDGTIERLPQQGTIFKIVIKRKKD